MLKRNVTLVLLLLLVPCLLIGQVKITKLAHKPIIDQQDQIPQNYNKTVKLAKTTAAVGESIGLTTNYDSWTNCIVRNQIVYWQGVKFANMVRPFGTGSASTRHVVYTERDSATGVYTSTDVFGGAAGWPDIDVERMGANVGQIGVVGHSQTMLGLWDGSAFQVSKFSGAGTTDPSFQFGNATIWLGNSGNTSRTQFQMFSSADGLSFTNWDSISVFSPKPIYYGSYGSVEMGISKSPDETQVVYYGANLADPTQTYLTDVFNGTPIDSCDDVWAVTTTNSGTTWTGKTIESDGVKGLVADYPNYAPMLNNWAQIDVAVTNSGVVHAVAQGYGYNFSTDTTVWKPILYYNSSTNKWIAISNHAIDTIQALETYRCGRLDGNSYPSVSASEDGKLIYVTWTGPQMTGSKIDTASDAAAPGTPYMWRDLYHTWSIDGGATWKTPTVLSGDKATSEEFSQAPQLLRWDPVQQKYVADIVYLAGLGAGNAIQVTGNTAYNNPIMYYAFTIPDVPTGVNDANQVVRSFNLSQNYPNPFNPSTKINYSLAEKSNVSLKVYDMLGREVANLVNATQEAGNHSVNFNASKLASGMYVYTLKSGNNVMSKKLMLLK
jgi:hypothetical protein